MLVKLGTARKAYQVSTAPESAGSPTAGDRTAWVLLSPPSPLAHGDLEQLA